MSTLQLVPDRATATALLADHDVVPVVAAIPLDGETPVSLMRRLGVDGHCFLLESADAGGMHGYSFLGHRPAAVSDDDAANPLGALEAVAAERVAPVPGFEAPFSGGWVGYLGYEAAAWFETLPLGGRAFDGVPVSSFALYREVVIVDHARELILLVAQLRRDAGDPAAAYRRAVAALGELHALVTSPRLPADGAVDNPRAVEVAPVTGHVHLRGHRLADAASTFPRARFLEAVDTALRHIVAGDVFQVQVSRRFTMPLRAHPFTLYTALRQSSPTPYLFYVSTPGCVLAGASPEMLVRVRGDAVEYRPIAGTRRRGFTAADDAAMEAELHASEKEQAEHLMLVDLGRNDVGRVAEIGSVEVHELAVIERYSRVMHLVSGIRARLAAGRTALDALRATFPAGTVTGAPKIRAMEVIAGLEPHPRGPYAGAVGYIGSGGAIDTAIALRTVVVVEGDAHLQAAAGIVADSTPAEEAREIDNKLAAALDAIARVDGWS